MIEKQKAIDALNRIDELACQVVENNDNGEAEQLAEDYSTVFDYISSQTACEHDEPYYNGASCSRCNSRIP